MAKNCTFQIVVSYNGRREVIRLAARDRREAIRKAQAFGATVISLKAR